MQQQNYANHRRLVPVFHFVTSGLAAAVFVLAIINLVHLIGTPDWIYTGLMPLLISVVLLLLFAFCRQFAVKVQDRAIRAEENFRHYLLTNKQLPAQLSMGQILALRFAADDEYLTLLQKAIAEQMKPDDIKKAIKNWKADNDRC